MNGCKVTLLFHADRLDANQQTAFAVDGAGWSESFYTTLTLEDDAHTVVRNFIALRATLLNRDSAVIGYRITELSGLERTIAVKWQKQGSSALRCDNPEQSLSWQMRAKHNANRRILTLRGIPDSRIEGGTYLHHRDYDAAITAFLTELIKNGSPWRFKGADLTTDEAPITSISSLGAVVLAEGMELANGDPVQVVRTIAAGHRLKGAKTTVVGVTSPTAITIADWRYGTTVRGTLRKIGEEQLFEMSITPEEMLRPDVRERQTGGPLKRSRGRRSAKYS